MPPVDPAAVRARVAQIADRFYDFPACAAALRALFSDYADRTHRPSRWLTDTSPTNAYRTPPPVVRQAVSALRRLALASPEAALGLLREIWAGGSREERRVAAELLGAIAPAEPEAALALAESWLPQLESSESTRALARHGLAPLALADPGAHLQSAQRWITSPQKWVRRFALELLTTLAKHKDWEDVPGALIVVRRAVDDAEPEVRSAAVEALEALLPKSPQEISLFLREQAGRTSHNAHLVVRAVLPRLGPEDQAALVRLMRA